MTPLQSWLLLIAVFAMLMLVCVIWFILIRAVIATWRAARSRRRARLRKLALNTLYGKRFQAHQTVSEDEIRFWLERGYPPQRRIEISRNGTGKEHHQ